MILFSCIIGSVHSSSNFAQLPIFLLDAGSCIRQTACSPFSPSHHSPRPARPFVGAGTRKRESSRGPRIEEHVRGRNGRAFAVETRTSTRGDRRRSQAPPARISDCYYGPKPQILF